MSDSVSDDCVVPGDTGAVRLGGRGFFLPGIGAWAMMRIGLLVVLVMLAAGCGSDKPEVAAGETLSEEALKQRCADAQWREKNLGIWYAVCRQPAAW
jgi:hypothetical protein